MSQLIRAKLELATLKEINAIQSIDAPLVSNNVSDYIQENELGYYILTNTWLQIVNQYSPRGAVALLDNMSRNGLMQTIKDASSAADSLVHGTPVSIGIFSSIYRDVVATLSRSVITPFETEKSINSDPMATMLFVLRYPKRFSPVYNTKIQKATLSDFLAVENRMKMVQRRESNRFLIPLIRDEVFHMLDWDSVIREAKDVLNDPHCLTLSSGACADANASIGSKLRAISDDFPEFFRAPFGIPYAGVIPTRIKPKWGKLIREERRCVKVRAVPKSYKASRIIAMEDTVRQGKAAEVQAILHRYIPKAIPLRDQSVNQRLACAASVSTDLATIDLSHASDCITKSMFWDIFPAEFSHMVYPLLGTHTDIDGNIRTMQQMSTAGNSLTFVLESIVFLAISRAAVTWYERITGDVPSYSGNLPVPSVYGDDIIIHDSIAYFLVDILETLGFKVNEDKSYIGEIKYRESCGAEFFNGVDVSSYYFPRFPIVGTIRKSTSFDSRFRIDSFTKELSDTTSSLVSLQQRLYSVCPDASFFVSEVLREGHPKMTTSLVGSRLGDMWGYSCTSVPRLGPSGWIEVCRCGYFFVKRILHKTKDERLVRSAKYLPSTRYKVKWWVSETDRRLLDLYKYNYFLRFGPSYSDPLMELLHVSDPPITESQAFGVPEIVWSLRETEPEE
jgi:hypothetical protein